VERAGQVDVAKLDADEVDVAAAAPRVDDRHVVGVNHLFSQAAKAAGVPDIGPHGMRHTAATLMLGPDVPLHVVSMRLGHADHGGVYAHVLERQRTDAAQAWPALYRTGGS
jgi:integrase